MNEKDNENLINIRISRAHELIAEPEEISELEYYNTAINRMYYASFSIVTALLFQHGFIPKTHAGARTLLNHHFVLTRKLNKESSKFYSEIFEMREDADYDFEKVFDEKTTMNFLKKTKKFVGNIEKLIAKGRMPKLF